METNVAELLKQSRQLSSEKMRLYDGYKDGCIDRELYKQKAEKDRQTVGRNQTKDSRV